MNKQPTHGGKRKGAGRKPGFKLPKSMKKEPTVVMRIPKGLQSHVKDLVKRYKKVMKKRPDGRDLNFGVIDEFTD